VTSDLASRLSGTRLAPALTVPSAANAGPMACGRAVVRR
jgi:hypothetical protein